MEITGTTMLRPEFGVRRAPDGRYVLAVIDLHSPAAVAVTLTREELACHLAGVNLEVDEVLEPTADFRDVGMVIHGPAPDDLHDGPDIVLGGEG